MPSPVAAAAASPAAAPPRAASPLTRAIPDSTADLTLPMPDPTAPAIWPIALWMRPLACCNMPCNIPSAMLRPCGMNFFAGLPMPIAVASVCIDCWASLLLPRAMMALLPPMPMASPCTMFLPKPMKTLLGD